MNEISRAPEKHLEIVNTIAPNERSVRMHRFIKTCCGENGLINVSSLIVISKHLLKAQKDRDKAYQSTSNDYKNQSPMARVREARCAEENGFWTELMQNVLTDMDHNGFNNI